jgi:hypothetical protein
MLTLLSDLIRHGKAHGNSTPANKYNGSDGSDGAASDISSRSTKTQPKAQASTHQQAAPAPQTNTEKEQIRQQAVAQNVPVPQLPSPDYTKEAQLIVEEERQSKEKMPVYQGLEKYKLVDKMGE